MTWHTWYKLANYDLYSSHFISLPSQFVTYTIHILHPGVIFILYMYQYMYSIVNGRAIATAQVNDRKFGLRTLGWTAINWERVEKARNIYIKHELICVTDRTFDCDFLRRKLLVAFIISLALMLLHSIYVWVWYTFFFSLSVLEACGKLC